MFITPVISDYLKALENAVNQGDATEHTHRPALKKLIESAGQNLLAVNILATNEPKRVACGAPDFSVSSPTEHGHFTLGYIETKDAGTALDPAEKSDQLRRYLSALSNLILTDYLEFRWYVDGEPRMTARLARMGKDGKLQLEPDGKAELEKLLGQFLSRKPEPIKNPQELAERMARITHMIRDVMVQAFENNSAGQVLLDLRKAFVEVLLPDFKSPEKVPDFADMFAQTLAYGLFAARCNHLGARGSFQRLGAAAEIPKTNPFLRKLFFSITGPDLDDEPYVGFVDDLVTMLAQTDLGAVLEHFGKRTKQEDPVVHFYETFLAAYDPKLREARGVYYTPEPVVSYMVRSVDLLLKEHFGVKDGLSDASAVTYIRDDPEVGEVEEPCPQVLILDPACGTGTFLYAVVNHIREKFIRGNNAGLWPGYVRNHLLPRLFGFELLMAPYAVAHFKLGMQLAAQDLPEGLRKKWACEFTENERLKIYLTNTLEEAEHKAQKEMYFLQFLTEEAAAAAAIKRDLPIMVILGNPPYSNYGQMNKGRWILDLLQNYKQGLREKKLNIDDDFIKFIRWAQWRIEKTGAGILGFITNNTYLDGLTHRRMRESLLETFTDIYILDLHGSSKKKEKCPDGGKDENVFDIQQGVAIGIFVKEPGKKKSHARVHHADLWGLRKDKFSRLLQSDLHQTPWRSPQPKKDHFFFVPKPMVGHQEYLSGFGLKDIFATSGPGIKTERDLISIHLDKSRLEATIKDFRKLEASALRKKYGLPPDSRDWKIVSAKEDVANHAGKEFFQMILYRPFDLRHIWYSGKTRGFIGTPGYPTMRNLLREKNLALLACRQQAQTGFHHVFCSRILTECCAVSLQTREITSVFPLYIYPDPQTNGDLFSNGLTRHSNLNYKFIDELSARLKMKFIADGKGDRKKTYGPEDVFHYLYAVFHSPTYRERYAEFLRIDFPRAPLPSSPQLFRKLGALGEELVGLHLLEKPAPVSTSFPEPGENQVEKVRYTEPEKREKTGRVWINPAQYFQGVPPEVWAFHVGGYQVCEKWLKDRKGRRLDYQDVTHYQRIIFALQGTIRIMAEIDRAIAQEGGWPIK